MINSLRYIRVNKSLTNWRGNKLGILSSFFILFLVFLLFNHFGLRLSGVKGSITLMTFILSLVEAVLSLLFAIYVI